MSLALEGFLELAHRFGRPLHQALRISFRLQQGLQIGRQGLVLHYGLLPPSSFPADPPSWLIAFSCLQCLESLADRLARDSCLASHLAGPSCASSLGLCRHIQPPLPLIKHSVHHLVLILLRKLYHALSLSHLPPTVYFIFVSLQSMFAQKGIVQNVVVITAQRVALIFPTSTYTGTDCK